MLLIIMNIMKLSLNSNKLLSASKRFKEIFDKRCISNLSEEIKRQNDIFDSEQKRQRESVGRIEKIEIKYYANGEEILLVMNKNISTPHDVAKHFGEKLADNSVVAQFNNDTLWHMHKPLPDSCKIDFLHYKIPQPNQVNKIFWRTCSFLLGAIAKNAFKDNIAVSLHSFPSPNVRSGSFVYDVQLDLPDWKPTDNELRVLSIDLVKFSQQNHPITSLDVDTGLAQDLFKNNPHKFQQIPDIAANHAGKVTLFRAGHHIDISRGPMAPNTGHLGRITLANVIRLNTDIEGGPIYRFQGVALPRSIILNHFAYSLLEDRAKELNAGRIPGKQEQSGEDTSFVAEIIQ